MVKKINPKDPDVDVKVLFSKVHDSIKKSSYKEFCSYKKCKKYVSHIIFEQNACRRYCLMHVPHFYPIEQAGKPQYATRAFDISLYSQAQFLLKHFSGTITIMENA